jgi:hypothetical protein
MLRRQFFTRTIGALVGAVCAPFVGKAGGEKYGAPGIQVVDIPDFQPSDFDLGPKCRWPADVYAGPVTSIEPSAGGVFIKTPDREWFLQDNKSWWPVVGR